MRTAAWPVTRPVPTALTRYVVGRLPQPRPSEVNPGASSCPENKGMIHHAGNQRLGKVSHVIQGNSSHAKEVKGIVKEEMVFFVTAFRF